MAKPSLPLSKKIIFSLGQLGWALTSYAPGMLLVYFYLPPDSAAGQTFPARIYQGYVLGILTIIGLAYGVGRLFDAVTDPLIAGLSDRSKAKMGRRRLFLAISVLPFALTSILIFTPPAAGQSPINSVWVFAFVIIFYWFMTMYVTPYFAFMSELGHTPDERLQLSTLISITWAVGTAIGTQVFAIKGAFEAGGMSATAAFQMTIALFAGIGFLFMLLPIIFIDEQKYGDGHANDQKIIASLKEALGNRDFRYFTISDLAYWVALTFASTGLVYYVTILLGLEEAFTSTLQILMYLVSFLFYVPTNLIAKKTGKKRLVLVAFVFFIIVYTYIIFLGKLPLAAQVQGYLVVLLMGIPLAIFGILPNAIIGDIAEADAITTGRHKNAIFYGTRTFMSKMGQMIGGLVFPSLLLLGSTPGKDIGIRLTGAAAIVFIVIGMVMFTLYDEQKILETLKKKRS